MRDGANIAASDESETLVLPLKAVDALRRRNIAYCHLRSSRRLPAVLLGDSDLDLLIAKSDQHLAAQALLACGLKRFETIAGRSHPAVESFLGYDEPTGRIVHLHLHFRLVVGERLLRNYQLPWEQAVLASAVPHATLPIRVLDPECEALLLTVRSGLELRRRDPITLRDWRMEQEKFELDRQELVTRVDPRRLRDLAAGLVSADLAQAIVDALFAPQPLAAQHHFRRRVRKDLAAHRTYNAVEAALRGLGRAILWSAGGLNKRFLHLPRPWGRRAPGGGIVVAVVGLDGSGKTTLVKAIGQWLGSEIDVLPVYLGTGQGRPSLLLLPLKLIVPLVTKAIPTKPAGASHGKISNRAPGPLYSFLLAIWAMAAAADKRVKLLAARRGADRGMVVITDRFPQDQLLDFNDAPLLPRLAHVPAWLSRIEADTYALARRLPPDLVIKLDASPEVIMAREPDMDPLIIRRRAAFLQQLTFQSVHVISVDAGRPLADVIRTAKAAIWRML